MAHDKHSAGFAWRLEPQKENTKNPPCPFTQRWSLSFKENQLYSIWPGTPEGEASERQGSETQTHASVWGWALHSEQESK